MSFFVAGGSPSWRRSSHDETDANQDREPPSTHRSAGAKREEQSVRHPDPWSHHARHTLSDVTFLKPPPARHQLRPWMTPTVIATTAMSCLSPKQASSLPELTVAFLRANYPCLSFLGRL